MPGTSVSGRGWKGQDHLQGKRGVQPNRIRGMRKEVIFGGNAQHKGESWLGTYEGALALRYTPMFETAFEVKSI